jgi:hypothetical protein
MLARERLALMASFIFFLARACLDGANCTIFEHLVREAPIAGEVFYRDIIKLRKLFLEFYVTIPVGYQYCAYAAVKPARSQQFFSYLHYILLHIVMEKILNVY